jgi:hypothetical protein
MYVFFMFATGDIVLPACRLPRAGHFQKIDKLHNLPLVPATSKPGSDNFPAASRRDMAFPTRSSDISY